MSSDDEYREPARRVSHAKPSAPAQRSVRERAGESEERSPSDQIAEIRKLYFAATAKTIQRDFERAIDLLKSLKDDEARGKAAVFMEGLAEMRKEWKGRGR